MFSNMSLALVPGVGHRRSGKEVGLVLEPLLPMVEVTFDMVR